jgi:gamma-glutamylcyclotransferase (GGCT)/AIG2-like uncharacterized protein YtfP
MEAVDAFRLFIERAEELRDSAFIQSGFVPALHARRDGTAPAVIDISEPDEDDLRSFLLTYRQFISNDEPIFVYMILKLCWTHIIDPNGKTAFANARKAWKALETGGVLQIVRNGCSVYPQETQDLWINGYYFHNDEQKRNRLDELSSGFQETIRHHFLEHVYEATKIILFVANQLENAFRVGAVKTA